MKHLSTILLITGGAVLAADVLYGSQKAAGQNTQWFDTTLGQVEGMVPFAPVWILLAVAGIGVRFIHR